jgi:hypothetical protein
VKTKICSKCKRRNPVEQFNKNPSKPRGLSSECKKCKKEVQDAWYQKHRREHLDRVHRNRDATRDKIKQWMIEYLQSHPCVDCGESDIVVLEFDHVRGDKSKDISVLMRNCNLSTLQTEVEKCDIRCANCHRRKTAKEHGYYRMGIMGLGK